MKRFLVVAMVAAIGLAGTMAYGQGYGPGPGPAGKQVDANALRQFQKETLPLRDELQAKRVELATEYNKETPDQNRITQLQKEMIDLRTKIQTAASKQGLPAWGYGSRTAGRGYGYGYGRGAGSGYGPRMMGCGYGPGYGRGPAW